MTRLGVILVLLFAGPFSIRAQTTVFFDDFNTATSSTPLNGLKPDQSNASGAAWAASSGITENGGVAKLASGTGNASLSLDVTGVKSVTIDASVTLTSGSALTLFFASSLSAVDAGGVGELSVQEHRVLVGLYDGTSTLDTSVAVTSGTYDLTLTYDLVDETVSASVNGTPAGSGSYAVSSSDALLSGTDTLYVGFGSEIGAGTVDNFSVVTAPNNATTTASPEPSVWILLALGLTAGSWAIRNRSKPHHAAT